MTVKAFWKSLTVQFNTVVATMVAALPLAMEQLPMLKEVLPSSWYMWALLAVTLGNVVIRARTNTAIGLKDA